MNERPQRACRSRGCPHVTRDRSGYCVEHRAMRNRHNVRGYKASHKLYNDRRWREASIAYRRANPLCVRFNECGGVAELVDHIVPVERGGKFWDRGNWQSMCQSCHNSKRQRER